MDNDEKIRNLVYGNGTSTSIKPTVLSFETMMEAIRLVEITPPPPVYFYSKYLEPDDVYQMEPGKFGSLFFFPFDRNTKVVYICGKNARDTLIEKGVIFENYKPEEENSK